MVIFNNSYVQVITFTLSIKSVYFERALKLAMVAIVTLVLGMLTLISCAKVRKSIAFAKL